MTVDLSAFQAELTRNTSISQSVKQALDTLKSQVDNLTQQLAQAGVDPATVSALADMQATLKANDDTVSAILAGTGAAGSVTGGGGADTTGGGSQTPPQPPADQTPPVNTSP